MELSEVMSAALQKALGNAQANTVVTAALLSTKYGALVGSTELAEILGVKAETVRQQISREQFPIPVTRIGGKWYATCYDIAEHLDNSKVRFRVSHV